MREGGRIRSEYMGRGELAESFALLDREERRLDAERRSQEEQARRKSEEKEREIGEWFDAVEAVARVAMQASEYRQHNRGEWRKSRGTH